MFGFLVYYYIKFWFVLKGEFCEFSNCNNEPQNCLTDFGTSFCNDASIANFCPKMCSMVLYSIFLYNSIESILCLSIIISRFVSVDLIHV
jgi:hypothetical protein